MQDYDELDRKWDSFLQEWPHDRLHTMRLEEYSTTTNTISFVNWIEIQLDKLGSIWGGSAFKFGVYARQNVGKREADTTRSYSDTHAWHTKLGDSAQEAFEKVREAIVNIARLAREGDLSGIAAIDALGPAVKWKIAFHYQDRSNPCMVAIFKPAPLAAYLQSAGRTSMAELQAGVIVKKPAQANLLSYSRGIWDAWSKKKLKIYKLSHGNEQFTDAERQRYLDSRLAVVHGLTGKDQGEEFSKAQIGTLFYLCHGNKSIEIIGQFTSEASPSEKGGGWLQRRYRLLKASESKASYAGESRGWTPNYRSTFFAVPSHDLPTFEARLLKPIFDTDLAELSTLAGEPVEMTAFSDEASEVVVSEADSDGTQAPEPVGASINRIYYGPPGTGKTRKLQKLLETEYQARDGTEGPRYSFVTFHQSYGYEEFVEGLRPVLMDGGQQHGSVAYEIRDGSFKALCKRARKNPAERFAMVIDEINRGNVSKILGELITLIETDKRDPLDGSLPPLELSLAYSQEGFSVPANVDIYGTMNTADRSLALLDTALRRRFEFVGVMPDTRLEAGPGEDEPPLAELTVQTGGSTIDVRRLLERMNERIEVLYDRDHCIGHAYLTSLRRHENQEQRFMAFTKIFRHQIFPLLEEYFFDDWSKIRLILADNQKPEQSLHFVLQNGGEDNSTALFGSDTDFDSAGMKSLYVIQETAFQDPRSYISIYE